MDKDLLIQRVKDINNEVNKIFDIVCDENEISVYKNILLNAKLNLLSDSLDQTMLGLIDSTIIEAQWFMIRRTFTIILAIIALISMFINFPIGLGIALVSGFCFHKLNKEAMAMSKEIMRVNEITKTANEMVTIFDNCYSFLNGRPNVDLENKPEELEDENLKKIDIANHHIEFVIATGVKEAVPEDIQETMIKMLQDDMKTDEKDLEKLLEMAAKKIMSEQLQNEQAMTLKRIKDEEGNNYNEW